MWRVMGNPQLQGAGVHTHEPQVLLAHNQPWKARMTRCARIKPCEASCRGMPPPSLTNIHAASPEPSLRMASHGSHPPMHPSPTYGWPHSSRTLPCTRALSTGGLALLPPSHAIEPSALVSSTPRPSLTLLSLLCTQTWGMLGREGGGGEARPMPYARPCPALPYARPCPCCLASRWLLLKRT